MPFKIYRSSAGSGKTFTLVKEYLRLSLATDRADNYRSILAITFTNKAAEEMKSRVIEVLDAISNPSEKQHDMAEILEEEIGLSSSELAIRARQTLRHMLHHYSDISISTIDHFTHGLIRSFAQDLELSVNFEVELDSDRISNEIIKTILSKVGEDKVLTKALLNVLENQVNDEKGWSISQTLHKFSGGLFSEESRFHLEKLKHVDLAEFNKLGGLIQQKVKSAETAMLNAANSAISELGEAGIPPEMTYYGNSGGPYSYFKKIASKKYELPGKRVTTSVEEDKWTSSKAGKAETAAIESIAPLLVSSIQTIIEECTRWKYLRIIHENLYGVALLDEMLRIQQQIQTDEELLHIGQFNHLVSEVVMKETAPFIYERIGYRYRHFLVDEFQDTSVLQWFNLLPLIDESLAHDNLCLVVGDAKQSIYRWRGGDVNQFVKLPDIYRTEYLDEKLHSEPEINQLMTEREGAMKGQEKVEHLTNNFRSASNVVSFNNRLFAGLEAAMNDDLKALYRNAEQNIKKEEEGLVDIRFFEKPGNDNQRWDEYTPLTLEQIEHWIDESLEDGFRPGDIAIILRGNRDAVTVAQHLVQKGHKVVSNESLLINSSAFVRTMVNLAVWLTYPEDHVNMVELIQNLGLVRGETDLTASRLNKLKNQPFIETTRLLTTLYPTAKWKELKQLSLFGMFEQLNFILETNANDAYINFFMDEVLGYSKTQSDGLLGFLEYWKEKRHKLSIAMPEGNDAIQIMTIHKSKGLEFPVVIHPFADYPTNNFGNDVWAYLDDDELAPLDRIRIKTGSKLEGTPFEELQTREQSLKEMDMFNELYVAFTRPKFRLYSCGWISQKNNTKTAIQHVYKQVVEQMPNVQETKHYQLGSRSKETPKETDRNVYKLNVSGNPNWSDRISISRPSKDRWKTVDESDARNLGILIHEAMAHIHYADDIDKAVSILTEDGRISKEESLQLKTRIEELFREPQVAPLYNSNHTIRNEAAIQLESGKWLRPDRIAFHEDQAWVLDYKTGKEKNQHIKQIKDYKEALRQLGFKQIDGVLVYVNDGKVLSV